MPEFEPIPIPPRQKWRQFRMNHLPNVVMLAAAAGVLYLWQLVVIPHRMVGEVQRVTARVVSPQLGTVVNIAVAAFDDVVAGDPIATVQTTAPDVMESTLGVIRAEIEALRSNLEPQLGRQRNSLRFAQLQLDWMDQRVELARAKVSLRRAEIELVRNQNLFFGDVVSKDAVERAQETRDALRAEIAEREALVESASQSLEALRAAAPRSLETSADAMAAAVGVQEQTLRLTEAQLSPVTLAAPISGQVRLIEKSVGESIGAGETVAMIAGREGVHILTYVQEPLRLQPMVGAGVEVKTRSSKVTGVGEVLHVGAQVEPMTNFHHRATASIRRGLPMIVSIPGDMTALPGELVDLRLVNLN